jgi:hypothetical protein
MEEDIREKVDIRSEDITGLNFIRDTGCYLFRRHYRQGLRSRIMAVLDAADVRRETVGHRVDGIQVFPRAYPKKMLRIFTSRFDRLDEALEEARIYKVIEASLGAGHVAASSEFIVSYRRAGHRPEILLCGLQDYVAGEILDPWGFVRKNHLEGLCRSVQAKQGVPGDDALVDLIQSARTSAGDLVDRLKKMILDAGCIPDLSGIGNLILTAAGDLVLVDINNVSRVVFDDLIRTDDKGYPVCDKSIEVLAILERRLLGRTIDMEEPIYHRFLDPGRMQQVGLLEEKFYAERRCGVDAE